MLKRLQFKLQYVSYIIAFSRNFFYFLYLRGVLHQISLLSIGYSAS